MPEQRQLEPPEGDLAVHRDEQPAGRGEPPHLRAGDGYRCGFGRQRCVDAGGLRHSRVHVEAVDLRIGSGTEHLGGTGAVRRNDGGVEVAHTGVAGHPGPAQPNRGVADRQVEAGAAASGDRARPEPGVPETVGDDEEQAAADVTSVNAAAATTRPHLSAPSGLARPDGAATQAMWKRRQRTAS